MNSVSNPLINTFESRLLFINFVMVSFALIEALILHYKKPGQLQWSEIWLSIGDCIGRVAISLVPLNVVLPAFELMKPYQILKIHMDSGFKYLLLFLWIEFFYYWSHRASHQMNLLWAAHSVHHTPNQVTVSSTLRLGWMEKLTNLNMIFFVPLVWLGFEPNLILTLLSLNFCYQILVHATWVPRLGWLEYIFVTPSSHRVHHASNPAYLDSNYGGVLIVFDRLFGTFREERQEEPCIYGLTQALNNPSLLQIEFQQYLSLFRQIRSEQKWMSKFILLISSPSASNEVIQGLEPAPELRD